MAIIRLSIPATAGLTKHDAWTRGDVQRHGASLLEATIDQKAMDQLRARLKGLPDKLAKKLETRAVKTATNLVAERARELCPVDTGALRETIKVRARRRSRLNKGSVGRAIITGTGFFTGETYYGGMIEFGTSKMSAQSFLRRAVIECEAAAIAIFHKDLKRMIDEEDMKHAVTGVAVTDLT